MELAGDNVESPRLSPCLVSAALASGKLRPASQAPLQFTERQGPELRDMTYSGKVRYTGKDAGILNGVDYSIYLKLANKVFSPCS